MGELNKIFEKPYVESQNIIEDIKEDIEELGKDYKCFVFYTQIEDHIIFTDYGHIAEEEPLELQRINAGEAVIVGTLGDALEAFKEQSWV